MRPMPHCLTERVKSRKHTSNRDEFPDHFRGNGIYFTKDPDWGTQLHVINWQGLCGFLKTQKKPDAILKNAFEKYVNTIKTSVPEANDLLENIGCYYYMRKKVPALSENGFDLINDLDSAKKRKISETMEFLRKELSKATDAQDIDLYNRRNKLISDGGPKDIEHL
ncbi:hypothetical protein ACYZT9_05375 [Pseudomonas sp. ZT5P21]